VLERPLHTERLTLRPATAGDPDSAWRFRQLESVNEWLTGGRANLDAYRKLFSETARLTTTVIVTLGHDATAPLIGDFMLRRENAWAQLDVADQARDTQALHREKGGLRAPALLHRHCASESDHTPSLPCAETKTLAPAHHQASGEDLRLANLRTATSPSAGPAFAVRRDSAGAR